MNVKIGCLVSGTGIRTNNRLIMSLFLNPYARILVLIVEVYLTYFSFVRRFYYILPTYRPTYLLPK